mgnify:FL=1
MTVRTLQANMTRGEVTPYVHARVDTEHYQAGLAEALNFIVLRYGGVVRCPGTLYQGPAKLANKKSRTIPFEFSRSQVYAIEAGDQYFRFWTPAGRVESPPGTPVEVATPYLEADLQYIQSRQSGDVLYLFCRGYQPQTLTRLSETSWVLADYVPQDGPYMDANVTATTLTPADYGSLTPKMSGLTAPSGTVTGIGGADAWKIFDKNPATGASDNDSNRSITYQLDGGAQVIVENYYLTATTGPEIDRTPTVWKVEGSNDGSTWTVLDSRQGETGWGSGERRYYEFFNKTPFEYHRFSWTGVDGASNANTFNELTFNKAAASQTAFNLTASSTTGINDGAGFVASDVGRPIRLLGSDGRWRWAEIISRTSSTVVTIKLHGYALPDLSPIINWRLGAWSDETGWPSAVAIYEDRLVGARTDADPLGIWASVNGDYDNFRTSVPTVDDDGIAVRLTGGTLNDIGWLVEGKDIVAGTAGSLRAVGRNNPNGALSPSNIRQRSETITPSSRAEPVNIENVLLYIDFYEQRLYEAAYTYEVEGYLAREVSTLNEHLFAAGVTKVVYLSHPHKIVVALRQDGKLIAFTYDRDQKVAGGTLVDVGGVVEDITALSGDTGTDLWLVVRRTINSATVRYVERLAEFWRSDFTVQDVPVYAACSVIYDGAPVSLITGLTHLAGETVGVWADGRDLGSLPVSSGGTLTLVGGVEASQVVIGKRMPARLKTLRLAQIGNQDGSGLGRKVSIATAAVDLLEAAGLSYGLTVSDAMQFEDQAEEDPSEPVPLRTGMFELPGNDGWQNSGVFVIETDKLYPATIRAISLEIDGEP